MKLLSSAFCPVQGKSHIVLHLFRFNKIVFFRILKSPDPRPKVSHLFLFFHCCLIFSFFFFDFCPCLSVAVFNFRMMCVFKVSRFHFPTPFPTLLFSFFLFFTMVRSSRRVFPCLPSFLRSPSSPSSASQRHRTSATQQPMCHRSPISQLVNILCFSVSFYYRV